MTLLTVTTPPGKWSTSGKVLVMTAADVGNGNEINASGDDLIIVQNTGLTAYTVSITSVADPQTGRTGDVTNQTLAAQEIRIFRVPRQGWADANGQINISANNAAVLFGVIPV